jgi:transcriptional regulator with XRE-family HTH domain
MKQGITIQERLKDLRTERHLKLEELAELTQISKSALGSYENDVKKKSATNPS